mmetsp:Transcript_5578/g.13003  ORF Transcript_5578/g.13003 Transcript_5578/m.13003 type:complete len:316 (+) Transcript_5578:103-1050(+)
MQEFAGLCLQSLPFALHLAHDPAQLRHVPVLDASLRILQLSEHGRLQSACLGILPVLLGSDHFEHGLLLAADLPLLVGGSLQGSFVLLLICVEHRERRRDITFPCTQVREHVLQRWRKWCRVPLGTLEAFCSPQQLLGRGLLRSLLLRQVLVLLLCCLLLQERLQEKLLLGKFLLELHQLHHLLVFGQLNLLGGQLLLQLLFPGLQGRHVVATCLQCVRKACELGDGCTDAFVHLRLRQVRSTLGCLDGCLHVCSGVRCDLLLFSGQPRKFSDLVNGFDGSIQCLDAFIGTPKVRVQPQSHDKQYCCHGRTECHS